MNPTPAWRPAHPNHRRLLRAAQQGDRAALNALVRCYEPLVRRVVWNLRPPLGCERDDLAQEARIGLIAAIRAWRPERGPFPAFADQCVRNQALLAVHAAARNKHQLLSRAVSLSARHWGDTTTDRDPRLAWVGAHDAHTDPEAWLLVTEQLTNVIRALPTLTASERRALSGTLNGYDYEQLAPLLGGTPKAAEHAAFRARRKLAAALPRAA